MYFLGKIRGKQEQEKTKQNADFDVKHQFEIEYQKQHVGLPSRKHICVPWQNVISQIANHKCIN